MTRERFVVLGLARARATWFASVAQWSTTGAAPLEFVKCISSDEMKAHLTGGRQVSAVLLDEALPTVDRDLIATARDAGAAALVVTAASRPTRSWTDLGATAVLPAELTREDLVDALASHCTLVADARASRDDVIPLPAHLGRVIAVTGPGGTGASIAAIALAQQLGFESEPGAVLLADLALRAEQAMLNDVRDIVPGIQEVVEAHRSRHLVAEDVRALTFDIESRGFSLLLGLRKARHWSTLQPRAFEAAFASLQHAYEAVVCDVTADVEGEEQSGSADVEDRNVMARTAVRSADAVVVVGVPGLKGVHALVRVIKDLVDVGVEAARIVIAVNQAPRSPRLRSEITAAVSQLLAGTPGSESMVSPVFLPTRRLESVLTDLAPMPSPLGAVLAGAVDATMTRATRRSAPVTAQPQAVEPGSLGTWTEQAG